MEKFTPEQEADFNDAISKNEKGELDDIREGSTNQKEALWAQTKNAEPVEDMFPNNPTIEKANINVGKALFKAIGALKTKEVELEELYRIMKEYHGVSKNELEKEIADTSKMSRADLEDFTKLKNDIFACTEEIEGIKSDLEKIRQIEES